MARRQPSRHRAIAAVVAVALVAITGGCSHDNRVHVPAGATVLVVGDSLTWQSQPAIEAAIRDAGWKPVVDGRAGSGIDGGVTIDQWPPRIAQLVQQSHPTVAIVELGTNGCRNCPHGVGAAIDADMQPLRHLRRVYWVNVKTYSAIPPDPKAINKAIDAAQKRWKQLRVIDMDGRFKDHRDLLDRDTTHFNPRGRLVFASMLLDALKKG